MPIPEENTEELEVESVSLPHTVPAETAVAAANQMTIAELAQQELVIASAKASIEGEDALAMPMSARISVAVGFSLARHPCKTFCGCWLLILLVTTICVVSGELRFSDNGSKDWQILDDEYNMQKDAMDLASEQVDCIKTSSGACPEAQVRSQKDLTLSLSLTYRAPEGQTMFTPKRVQQACKLEQIVLQNKYYPQFCALKAGALKQVASEKRDYNLTDCQPPGTSIVDIFYAGRNRCDLLPEKLVELVASSLLEGLSDPVKRLQSGFFLEAGTIDKLPRMTRSLFALGRPLAGPGGESSISSRAEATSAFWDSVEQDFMNHFGKASSFLRSAYWEQWIKEDVELLFYSYPLAQMESRRVVNSDTSFVLLAIICVISWLCIHTGSMFIGIISLGQIVFSIPTGFFLYRFIGQVTFFQQLHVILIFIMLGVGADAVFVFSDAWYQSVELMAARKTSVRSKSTDESSLLASRIAVAYQRTLVSVFNTSFTTGVAFLATAISPIMPIRTMGIYACLLVMMNYLFVITITPAAFAVWHTYGLACPCRLPRAGRKTDTENGGGRHVVAPDKDEQGRPPPIPQDAGNSKSFSDVERPAQKGLLERTVIPLLQHPAASVACIVILGIWGAVNVYFTSRLEPPPEMFQYFSNDHMQSKAVAFQRDGFVAGSGSDYLTLRLTFGIQGVDRSPGDKTVDPWAPHLFYGEPVWDKDFDISLPEAQDFLRGFCVRMRESSCTAEACRNGLLFQPSNSSVSCFIEEFDAWNNGTRFSGNEFVSLLSTFRTTQKPLNGGSWKDSIGFIDGKLRFVQLEGKMTARKYLPSKLKKGILDDIKSWLQNESGRAPSSVGTILQTGGFDWTFYSLETELVNGLFTGFAICFPVSFLVLLFATGNIFVAFFAILTIVLIVMNVLGWCWFVEGWSLGVSESIAGVIVIGLSVDYVIHLGHMYLEMGHQGCHTRVERWTMALKNMGTTVLAGSATTFLAGMTMRACQMTFFIQMSTLISVTIFYSLLYALFFFMCILRLIGPEGQFGDVPTAIKRLMHVMGRSKSTNS